MGVVYDGYDPTIDRRVAVKVILKSHSIDEEMAQAYSVRFVREARAAGRLNHPNIVQVYDFGEQEDIAYLVMEFIQGRELRSFFSAKEQFDIRESVRIMDELLAALDFAHEAGVIHRDVKPANVMLDSQRRAKLADFGVARIQDSERSAADTMVGTPAYMSPEQISGKKIDRRTDIFSAGSILYQFLTGEQPFKGEGTWTVAKQIMQDDPPPPSRVATIVSPAFDEIVNRALAKDPAQRYANAREFAEALRGALAGTSPASVVVPPRPKAKREAHTSEGEVEFWRSIQNSTDPNELEFYLEQFPEGTYARLARHKISKLREPATPDVQATVRIGGEEKAREEADAKSRREAEEKARSEAIEKARREAEEKARSEAIEKTRREAQDKERRRAAEEKAREEADAKSRREAEEKARSEAIEKARREAEEKARSEAIEKTRREAQDKERRRAAEEKARQEAEAKARREAEERAKREAEEKDRLQKEAAAHAKAAAVEGTAVATGGGMPAAPRRVERSTSYALPAAAVVVLVAVGVGAYLFLGRTKAIDPVAQAPAPVVPQKADVSGDEIEKIRREAEERIRREYAEKSAAEQAAAKAAADKALQEKQLAAKAVAEKAVTQKAAAEKLAAEKAAAEKAVATRVAAEKSAAERAAAEKAAAERAAAEKAAAEKVAAEKAAAEKAAAEKVAAAKPAAAPAASLAPEAPAVSADTLHRQATALEGEGKMVEAVRVYIQAARIGSGPAAKRLGDIYYSGVPGVSPDHAESVKWHAIARRRGIEVRPAGR
jgi:serine/threonine protein kinase